MNNPSLKAVISVIEEVMKEQGLKAPTLSPSTDILKDTGLDSIALSVVIVKLEEHTGKDPFVTGFRNFRTIEELAKLYEP